MLELRNCSISNYGSECIVDGMAKNTTLKQLDLTNNKITSAGVKRWSEVLGKTGLTHLDLSCNEFGDEGTLALVKGLSFGPTPPQAQVHAMLSQ